MNRKTGHPKITVNMFDLVAAIARVVDIMSPAVGDHHLKVAYLAFRIGEALRLPLSKQYELATAGALHDIGAFSLQERLDLLAFEDSHPGRHSMAGFLLLNDFKPFSSIARIIKFHHVPWKGGKGARQNGEDIPLESHIIHLADRAAVKFSNTKPALVQACDICDTIRKSGKSVFIPEGIDALRELSRHDYVWLELASNNIESILKRELMGRADILKLNDLLDFGWLICRLVDFKSKFTATHSCGVAATAVALAKKKKFSNYKMKLIELAAYLHDIGKLAIPNEIIEKPGKLNDDEWCIMRSHVYYTYQILEPLDKLKRVTSWGALHQERLNGKGYPFGYRAAELPLGSRIMAVADVFTALTEDRPYRKGMGRQETLKVLKSMANRQELDDGLINIVELSASRS
ncbi:MAG: HD domain-containing protein [Desulfobacterales bacterium]|nr:HD domain-containing protein [Desulfobacterales bacterium]